MSIVLLGESTSPAFWVSCGLMALGVVLHLSERHEHMHTHEPLEHMHSHMHDEHHQHGHDLTWDGAEPHEHPHRHEVLTHSHPHYPDIHHRHPHQRVSKIL